MDMLSQTMGSSQNFCLRWNNFASNISSAFKDLRERSELLDVTLGASDSEGRTLQAHSIILASCSTFFRNVINQANGHNGHQKIFIYLKGISYHDLSQVLDFMYSRKIYVVKKDLNSLLSVIEELQINVNSVGLTCIEEDENGNRSNDRKATGSMEGDNNTDDIVKEECQLDQQPKQDDQLTVDLDEFQKNINCSTEQENEQDKSSQNGKKKFKKQASAKESDKNEDPEDNHKTRRVSFQESESTPELSKDSPETEDIPESKDDDVDNESAEASLESTKDSQADRNDSAPSSSRKPGPKRVRERQSSVISNGGDDKVSQGDSKKGSGKVPNKKTDRSSDIEVIGSEGSENKMKRKNVSWPPDKGSMIAVLYTDGFYIGKVIDEVNKYGNVKVSYMIRHKYAEKPNAHEDQYWAWPDKRDIYDTAPESLLGENLRIEMVGKFDDKGVYKLHDFEDMSRLANDSKKTIIGKKAKKGR